MNPLYSNDRSGVCPQSYYAATAMLLPEIPTLAAAGKPDVCIIGGDKQVDPCQTRPAGRQIKPERGPIESVDRNSFATPTDNTPIHTVPSMSAPCDVE